MYLQKSDILRKNQRQKHVELFEYHQGSFLVESTNKGQSWHSEYSVCLACPALAPSPVLHSLLAQQHDQEFQFSLGYKNKIIRLKKNQTNSTAVGT